MHGPSPQEATARLAAEGVDDAASVLAAAGGAPYAARDAARDADQIAARRALLAFLSRPGTEAAMSTAEAFGRGPAGPPVRWLQQWVADCVSMRLAGRIRYHPTQAAAVSAIAARGRSGSLLRLAARLDAVRRSIDHPLNTRLLLETLLIAYVDALAPAE